MNAPIERTWKTVESGPHTLEGTLHPVVVKNYGKWKYHKMIKPGVMVHYGLSGDALYTVRAGTPRQNTVDLVRQIVNVQDDLFPWMGMLQSRPRKQCTFLHQPSMNVCYLQ